MEKQPSEPFDDESLVNDYDEVAKNAGDAGMCSPIEDPPATETWHIESNEDGSCFMLAGPMGEYGSSLEQKWVTTCKGSACFCVENNVVVCACETDGAWCEEQIPSCCPAPFP